jgi:hypothetical protein
MKRWLTALQKQDPAQASKVRAKLKAMGWLERVDSST